MEDAIYCPKCRMNFRKERPRSVCNDAESTRCSIKGCNRLFFHSSGGGFKINGRQTAYVWVENGDDSHVRK